MPRSDASCDVLVIGAGPAGSTAGTLLARDGFDVRCVERSSFPRHVIGESLLPRCTRLLRDAGLLAAVESRRYTVKAGATFLRGGERVRFAFADGLAGDEPTTHQVPRDDLDDTLATVAADAGVALAFGHAVDGIEFGSDAAVATVTDVATGGRATIRARFVLDCSGSAMIVPRQLGIVRRSPLGARVACYAQYLNDRRPADESAGDIWICIDSHGSWLWLIPFSDGRTSVGVVCDPARWERLPGDAASRLDAVIRAEPNAAGRLADATIAGPVRTVSDYSTSVESLCGPRWALAGNAGGFLDPVFSSGVTLALESASLAARLVARDLSGARVDWRSGYEAPIRAATDVFQAFVESWYRRELEAIVFADAKSPRIRRCLTSILGGNVLRDDNPLLDDLRGDLRRIHAAVAGA